VTARVPVLPGSLREASLSRRLARHAASLAPAELELVAFDALAAVEPFNEDLEAPTGFPPGAAALAAALRAADGALIVTPEYNGSIPGQLKNALDWMSRPEDAAGGLAESVVFGMPVMVASISTGQFGAAWARDELVKVLRTQGARPIHEPAVSVPRGAEAFDDDGALSSAQTTDRLVDLLGQLGRTIEQLRAARAAATS